MSDRWFIRGANGGWPGYIQLLDISTPTYIWYPDGLGNKGYEKEVLLTELSDLIRSKWWVEIPDPTIDEDLKVDEVF